MKLFLIRHATAMRHEDFAKEFSKNATKEFSGADDLRRPLTAEGRKKAGRAFEGFFSFFGAPDHIFHSRAVRSRDTAAILAGKTGAPVSETNLLDPGANYDSLLKLLQEPRARVERLALVGHEPDFSEMVSGLLRRNPGESRAFLHLDIKKASCIEIELYASGAGELVSMLPPKVLRRLARSGD